MSSGLRSQGACLSLNSQGFQNTTELIEEVSLRVRRFHWPDPLLAEGQGSKLLATLLLMCCQAGYHHPIGLSSLVLQSNLSTPETKTATTVTMGLEALRMAGTCWGAGGSAPWKTCTLPYLYFPLVPGALKMGGPTCSQARAACTEDAEPGSRLGCFTGWFWKHMVLLFPQCQVQPCHLGVHWKVPIAQCFCKVFTSAAC